MVHLFFNNTSVEACNRRTIPTISNIRIEVVTTDTYTCYITDAEQSDARGKVHHMGMAETGNLPYFITFTPGYPYILTINADVEDGIDNGEIGTLQQIEEVKLQQTEALVRTDQDCSVLL